TKLSSTGGFLRSGNTTLLIGVDETELDLALQIVRDSSSSRKSTISTTISPSGMGSSYLPYPVEVNVGGATVFVIDVDHYERM
ncbi:MAG TPA: cyclic-di-AMP receptor, partial [Candidatus Eisenbacteria bacterium]|nr:cyclic-di-AMP receptor [Candidatus Eisenbacteria bacterium]HZJ69247.1 cyclic-di-AMP receptor [Candidatus Eisenbacteria bacterium]